MKRTQFNDACVIPLELSSEYLALDGIEAEVIARYTYYPPVPGLRDGPGGPPIEPDTPGSVEVTSVVLRLGACCVDLSSYDEDEVRRKCLEHAEES